MRLLIVCSLQSVGSTLHSSFRCVKKSPDFLIVSRFTSTRREKRKTRRGGQQSQRSHPQSSFMYFKNFTTQIKTSLTAACRTTGVQLVLVFVTVLTDLC